MQTANAVITIAVVTAIFYIGVYFYSLRIIKREIKKIEDAAARYLLRQHKKQHDAMERQHEREFSQYN